MHYLHLKQNNCLCSLLDKIKKNIYIYIVSNFIIQLILLLCTCYAS